MSRFQQGSLFKVNGKSVPDVWVFRWYDTPWESGHIKSKSSGTYQTAKPTGSGKDRQVFVVLSMLTSERRRLCAISPPIID